MLLACEELGDKHFGVTLTYRSPQTLVLGLNSSGFTFIPLYVSYQHKRQLNLEKFNSSMSMIQSGFN